MIFPQSVRAVVGAFVLAGFLFCFLLFFVSLAVYNLLNGDGIIPSTIWLLLVMTLICGFCKERGAKQWLIDIAGNFARKQFVGSLRGGDGQNEIQFGYEIFGCRLLYLVIPLTSIESVNWSTGQASHLAGRDMDDWSVAVWYDHGDAIKSQNQQNQRKPDQDVYIVGHTGPQKEVAAFGRALVDFLKKSEAPLVQGKNDCTFVRQSVKS